VSGRILDYITNMTLLRQLCAADGPVHFGRPPPSFAAEAQVFGSPQEPRRKPLLRHDACSD
jgi:hypothetical protein